MRDTDNRDVDDCKDEILAVLKRYNCEISFDDELGNDDDLGEIVLVDLDNLQYASIKII